MLKDDREIIIAKIMEAAKEAYMAIPPVSRYYISLVFLQSFAATYRIINPYYLVLDFEKVFGSF